MPDYKELNEVLRIVQKVIFRTDGFVRQFLVDDKGLPFLSPFQLGLTPQAAP